MTMKLIGAVTSPYVRKVRVVLAEKKLDYTFVTEDVWSADTSIHASNRWAKYLAWCSTVQRPCLIRA